MNLTTHEIDVIRVCLQDRINFLRGKQGSATVLHDEEWHKQLGDQIKEVDTLLYRFCTENK
jgi:hypothetical protein